MTGRLTAVDALTLLIARELRDGDRLHVGANQDLIVDAVLLAGATRGVRIGLTFGGGLWFSDPVRASGLRTYDRITVESFDAPLDQERAFDDLMNPPMVFAGGLQVDRSGNVNLIGIGDPVSGWKVRGPGSAGLPSLTGLSSTYFAYALRHDARSFVDRVEHISAVGSPILRERLRLPALERAAVFTPLGRFEHVGEHLGLVALAPDVTVHDVVAATPFPLAGDPRAAEPIIPSAEETGWLAARSDKRVEND